MNVSKCLLEDTEIEL